MLFEAIPTAELLESAFKNREKHLPVSEIVADAQLDPRARLANGTWSDTYMEDVDLALRDFIDEHLPNLLTCYQFDDGEGCTRRRKAVGSMVFADDNGCIGHEATWHQKRMKILKILRINRMK